MRVSTTPVDGWSAYYALLTEALSASPSATPDRAQAPVARRRSLGERIDQWLAGKRQAEQERYLAQSADVCELEQRLRDLQFRRYY